jgi:hypothetical protein
MKKTQVQIPDHLYYRAKEIAAERELSFAEVVRRGLEYVVRVYLPPAKAGQTREWEPPTVSADRFEQNCDSIQLEAVREQELVERLSPLQKQERS